MVNSNMAISETELTDSGDSQKYTLTLDPNGGFIEDVGSTDSSRKTTKPYVKNVTFNQQIGYLPSPVRPGYTFKGWFKTQGGFWTQMPNTYPYKEQIQLQSGNNWLWKRNATFEARWQPVNCTLTWDGNGGLPKTWVDGSVPYGSILGGMSNPNHPIHNPPRRTGYKFLGWFTHPTHGVQVNEYTNVEANKVRAQYVKTYYAHWEKIPDED